MNRQLVSVLSALAISALTLLSPDVSLAQDGEEAIVVTNKSGREVSYRFRAIYNDGNGSAQRYGSVSHADGATRRLTAAGVPDYGIVLRLPGTDDDYGHKLYAQRGPYELCAGENPFDPTAIVYEIYDGEGNKVTAIEIAD